MSGSHREMFETATGKHDRVGRSERSGASNIQILRAHKRTAWRATTPPKVRPVLAEIRMRPREFKKSVSCKSWQIGWRIYLVGDLLQASSEEYIGGAYCRL
jgi:hypothetical protein